MEAGAGNDGGDEPVDDVDPCMCTGTNLQVPKWTEDMVFYIDVQGY